MIRIRDVLKSVESIVIVFCAVFVCTVFLNYWLDLGSISAATGDPVLGAIYDGQVSLATMMVVLCGGVMGLLSALMLVFAVGRFVEKNRANMGVLKALGYGRAAIAMRFVKFGLTVLIGAAAGCACGYAFAPLMYDVMGADLPAVDVAFHALVPVCLVALPTLLFAMIAFAAAFVKLSKPPLAMIRGERSRKAGSLNAKWQSKTSATDFPKVIRRSMLLSGILLVFFVGFASFAFSSEIQMAFTMSSLDMSPFFSVFMVVLGLVMGCTMLFFAFRFVFNSHDKYVSLMKAYGYTVHECRRALFGGYRIVSYVGFALGSVYQYFLFSFLMTLFGDAYDLTVEFSVPGFFITLAAFIVFYEATMYFYLHRINRLPLGRVMQS